MTLKAVPSGGQRFDKLPGAIWSAAGARRRPQAPAGTKAGCLCDNRVSLRTEELATTVILWAI
jgi:hypothetical protein